MERRYQCLDCSWVGNYSKLLKVYEGRGTDASPVVHCPDCYSYNIVEIDDNPAKLEPCFA